MKNSAFNVEGEHEPDMCAGVQEHGHEMVTHMTKHAKGPHGRGFHGNGGKGNKVAQGGGEGMAHNRKGGKED